MFYDNVHIVVLLFVTFIIITLISALDTINVEYVVYWE